MNVNFGQEHHLDVAVRENLAREPLLGGSSPSVWTHQFSYLTVLVQQTITFHVMNFWLGQLLAGAPLRRRGAGPREDCTGLFQGEQVCLARSPTHAYTHTHTHSHSHSHSHTHTLTHSHTHTLTHSHTRKLTHSHTHTLTYSHTHTLTLAHTPTVAP